jgi:hypothetical protein
LAGVDFVGLRVVGILVVCVIVGLLVVAGSPIDMLTSPVAIAGIDPIDMSSIAGASRRLL